MGASGAIAGVLGAYFILYPRARVLTWFFVFRVLPAGLGHAGILVCVSVLRGSGYAFDGDGPGAMWEAWRYGPTWADLSRDW